MPPFTILRYFFPEVPSYRHITIFSPTSFFTFVIAAITLITSLRQIAIVPPVFTSVKVAYILIPSLRQTVIVTPATSLISDPSLRQIFIVPPAFISVLSPVLRQVAVVTPSSHYLNITIILRLSVVKYYWAIPCQTSKKKGRSQKVTFL